MHARLNPADALTYARQAGRALADLRFNGLGRLREFVVAALYLHYVTRRRKDIGGAAARMLGMSTNEYISTLAKDAPRYQPPWEGDLLCPVPTPRKPACHRRGTSISFRVTDPATGRWRMVGYCSRHSVQAQAEFQAERERVRAGLPEPVPNTGGLLMCYLLLKPKQIKRLYAQVSPGWEPSGWGMCADDWPQDAPGPVERPELTVVPAPSPSPEREALPRPDGRPRLRLIT